MKAEDGIESNLQEFYVELQLIKERLQQLDRVLSLPNFFLVIISACIIFYTIGTNGNLSDCINDKGKYFERRK